MGTQSVIAVVKGIFHCTVPYASGNQSTIIFGTFITNLKSKFMCSKRMHLLTFLDQKIYRLSFHLEVHTFRN
jgi:hypothetical protein